MPRASRLDDATKDRIRELCCAGHSGREIAEKVGQKYHVVKYFIQYARDGSMPEPTNKHRNPVFRVVGDRTVYGHTHRKCLRCSVEFKKQFHFNFLCEKCGAYARATGESNYAG